MCDCQLSLREAIDINALTFWPAYCYGQKVRVLIPWRGETLWLTSCEAARSALAVSLDISNSFLHSLPALNFLVELYISPFRC